MNFKNNTFPDEPRRKEEHSFRLPSVVKLTNLTNQPEKSQLQALKRRVQELQIKVSSLQSKMRNKRKRIRRKSSQVQKRHKCQFCKKLYGSLVSLNLHLRIKHRRERSRVEGVNQDPKQEQNKIQEQE